MFMFFYLYNNDTVMRFCARLDTHLLLFLFFCFVFVFVLFYCDIS